MFTYLIPYLFCISSFSLVEYRYELRGGGDVLYLSVRTQDNDVPSTNQQEAVESWVAQ